MSVASALFYVYACMYVCMYCFCFVLCICLYVSLCMLVYACVCLCMLGVCGRGVFCWGAILSSLYVYIIYLCIGLVQDGDVEILEKQSESRLA